MIAKTIGGFVAILMGLGMLTPMATEINTATVAGSALQNSTTYGATVLNLLPGFFVLALLGVGAALVMSGLDEAGAI